MFKYDLKFSKKKTFLAVSLIPLVLYLLIETSNFLSFSSILGIGGVVSGGVTGILILLIALKSKKWKGRIRKPEIKMPINWPIIIILSIILITGIILEFTH